MQLKDLLSFYFERSNAANGLWGFYITVVLALLAYFGTGAPSGPKTVLAMIVSIGFIGFAYVNANAILEVSEAREATARLIRVCQDSAHQPDLDEIKKSVNPPSTRKTRQFHIASDIAVLVGLWVLTLYKH